ncbi:uncharacterized protein LOC123559445 [Mercenaria mercenaria]|uniref:uncharacterized protein LOC123559445 n=1 Tax=Mercenaria mercenaria TaxID=6596 RepID=UPI00234F5028|nr:uncharacterized protein LOC123559445 [Mercenaria mercenaria]
MSKNVLLLSLLSMVSGQGTFYVPTTMSYWANYDEECVPATPNVDAAVSYSPSVYDIDNPRIDLPDNEDVWVGYYQVVRVFEYIGCVEHRHLFRFDPQYVKIKGDPGHCFPGCNESTIIGVTKTRCYCLGDEFNFTRNYESGCIVICNRPTVACGQDRSPVKYSYISIYKINLHVNASSISVSLTSSGDQDCLHLDPSVPKLFYWSTCTLRFKAMCFYEGSVGRVEDFSCKGVSEYCSWIDAANTCFYKRLFPTLYSNSKDLIKETSSPLWTGLFKTNVVYKYNANIPDERRHDKKQFGYLTNKGNNNVKLRFAEADSMKRVLCIKDRNKIKTQTTHVTKSESFSVKTTQLSSSPSTTLLNTSNTGSSVTVSTIIAVISIVVVAVIIAVFAVLLVKKRHQTTKEDNDTGEASEEIGIQNPQRIVYESLGERHDGEHSYGTVNIQNSAYESLGERHDEDHSYGKPNTQRSAYESFGERHDEEHSYGTPNKHRSAYESLGDRHGEEHSYGASAQATSGFYEPLEEERVDTHNYEIAKQPRELAYDSQRGKIKETHCDETSHQTAKVETYEWVE